MQPESASPDRLFGPDSLDAEYRFGRPKVYLSPHELARLTLVRSRLGETRIEREAELIPQSARPHSARRRGR